MQIDEPNTCRPLTVTGEVHLDDHADIAKAKTHALSVAGVDIASAEMRDGSDGALAPTAPWRSMSLKRIPTNGLPGVQPVTVLSGNVKGWDQTFGPSFRLHVIQHDSAGYRVCYVTSPALFEYAGDSTYWSAAQELGQMWFDNNTSFRVDYAPLTDAIVRMAVAGMLPDRGSLDAGAIVQRRTALLTCTADVPVDASADPSKSFEPWRQLATASNCASIQRFVASDAANDLNRRIFVAGLLASAAVGMLLEALVLGRTEGEGEANVEGETSS